MWGENPGVWPLCHNFKKKTYLNNDKICLCLNHLIVNTVQPLFQGVKQLRGCIPPSSPKVYESCVLTGLYALSGPIMFILSPQIKRIMILFGFVLCFYFGT